MLPTLAKRLASAAAFALSAAVRPLGRSYTTTAGYTLGDTNWERRFSTCVDSARGGSQAWASFFSAPVSFPESGPASATRTSQNTSTSHLVLRPAGMRVIPLVFATTDLLSPWGPPCRRFACHVDGPAPHSSSDYEEETQVV